MGARLASPGANRFSLDQMSEINVTPFVDVMLVLLIVMMVAVPLATTTIRLDLPPNLPNPASPKPPPIVSVAADGRIYLITDGATRPTSLDALGSDLAGVVRADGWVSVRAETHARYGAFVAVVDRLRSDGYAKIGLLSEEAPARR